MEDLEDLGHKLFAGMHQGEGQVGQLPHQILADQKAPPGSGGAPHYYLPHRIFDPWCIPVAFIQRIFIKFNSRKRTLVYQLLNIHKYLEV